MRVAPSTRESVIAVQRELVVALGSLASHLEATHPDDLHATLKFLGNTEPARLEAARGVIERLASERAPIDAQLVGVDAFRSAREPRAIFGRVGAGRERLEALMEDVDEACAALGFAPEREARVPHVTLFRVKKAPRGALAEAIEALFVRPLGPLQSDGVFLFASEARDAGPRYHVLAEATLRGAA